jgi:hypothetical protein
MSAATAANITSRCGMVDIPSNAELATAIKSSAGRLGIDPVDLATAISYETGGRMSPQIWGGSGGRHLGLIQFGPEEQRKYGVNDKQSAVEQMGAVESYLRDRGVKPGMGLLDVYSTINAGRPGRYSASDANNGGAPGTVEDKVRGMVAHRARAQMLLGQAPDVTRVDASANAPAATGKAPFGLAPAEQPADDQNFATILEMAKRATAIEDEPLAPALPPMVLGQLLGRKA